MLLNIFKDDSITIETDNIVYVCKTDARLYVLTTETSSFGKIKINGNYFRHYNPEVYNKVANDPNSTIYVKDINKYSRIYSALREKLFINISKKFKFDYFINGGANFSIANDDHVFIPIDVLYQMYKNNDNIKFRNTDIKKLCKIIDSNSELFRYKTQKTELEPLLNLYKYMYEDPHTEILLEGVYAYDDEYGIYTEFIEFIESATPVEGLSWEDNDLTSEYDENEIYLGLYCENKEYYLVSPCPHSTGNSLNLVKINNNDTYKEICEKIIEWKILKERE